MIRRNKAIAPREYFQNFGLGHGEGVCFQLSYTSRRQGGILPFPTGLSKQPGNHNSCPDPSRANKIDSPSAIPANRSSIPHPLPCLELGSGGVVSPFWRVRSHDAAVSAVLSAVGYARDDVPIPTGAF